jgi:hypothetical protein
VPQNGTKFDWEKQYLLFNINGLVAGWGGRTRTSEWRNQNSLAIIDLAPHFSRPAKKQPVLYQSVSGIFPTEKAVEKSGPSAAQCSLSELERTNSKLAVYVRF